MATKWRNGGLSAVKVIELYRKDCVHCRRSWSDSVRPTVEHLVPKSKGGSNHSSNLALACATCNNQRWSLSIEEFYDWYAEFRTHEGCPIVRKIRKPRMWYHGDLFPWYP